MQFRISSFLGSGVGRGHRQHCASTSPWQQSAGADRSIMAIHYPASTPLRRPFPLRAWCLWESELKNPKSGSIRDKNNTYKNKVGKNFEKQKGASCHYASV